MNQLNCCLSTVRNLCRSRASRIGASFALMLSLGFTATSQAEIFAFRTAQGNPPIPMAGVTLNVHAGPGNTVDFTFINICGASTTGRIKELAFYDPCSPGAIVQNTAALIGNQPGCTNSGDVCTGAAPCVNYTIGGSLSVNFECTFVSNVVISPVNTDGSIDKGEMLTVRFNLNLQPGETAAQALTRLLNCMEGASFNPCVNGFRVAIKFQGTDPGGGGSNAINYPQAFPPEDCNQNGIPDVCDISCNGFNGLCNILSPFCGQFPNGFGVPAPTNVQATPATVCAGSSSQLSATATAPNTLEWFSGSCGGQLSPFATGSPVSSGPVNATTTFFVRQKTPAGCFSDCAQVTVNTAPAPVAPTSASVNRNNFCPNDAGTITLTAVGGSGTTLRWFDNFCGGNSIGTGTPLTINSPSVNTTYFARWESPPCPASTCASVAVTVVDNPPVITNCATLAKSASANASCQAPVPNFLADVIATDDCTPVNQLTMSQSPVAGTLVGLGVTPVTITVSDGPTPPRSAVTCSTTFTVTDTTAPTITCGAPKSASANANCQAAVPNFIPDVTASDNCTPAGSLTFTQVPPAGTLVGLGLTNITITVKDAAQNPATCNTSFTVNDTTPPNITTCPPPQSAFANGQCQAPVPNFIPNVVASDNCTAQGNLTITQDPIAGTLVGKGVTTVTITVKDQANNPKTCTTTFTVTDNSPPTIACPPPVNLFADSNCNAQVPDLTGLVTVADNCTPANQLIVTQTPPAGTVIPGPTATVPVTVTVVNPQDGLSASCTTQINVSDNMAATLTMCAGPESIPANPDTCNAPLPDLRGLVMATDNCSFTVGQSPAPGTVVGIGPNDVTLTVTDPSGLPANNSPCTAVVTVVDNTKPVIDQCAPPLSAEAGAGCQAPVPDFTGSVQAHDSCTLTPNLTITQVPAAGTMVGVGSTLVTITVTDQSTNSSMCTTTFTVTDTTPPVVTCPGNIIQSTDPSTCGADVSFEASFSDTCGLQSSGCIPASGSTFPIGMTTVTCSATDVNSNSASCSFTVTVNDLEAPTFTTCPGNITQASDPNTCGAIVEYDVTATDNCTSGPNNGVTLQCSMPSGSTFPIGTTTVTCTATDNSENSSTCVFDVTVNDTQAPSIVCPANITVERAEGQCGTVVNYTTPTAEDCSTTTVVCVMPSGSFFPAGTTQVTCTATDAALNTASCTFNVTVVGDCDDGNPCTTDTCDPNTHQCAHTPIEGCCLGPADCDDGDCGTADGCINGVCTHTIIDADGDGVPDCRDLCPDTPAGEAVDANGCSCSQQDDDGDGVNNCTDQCPDTPAGEAVDAVGCPLPPAPQTNPCDIDSDGDGVPDCRDLCPGTPPGTHVDANGCCKGPKGGPLNIMFSAGWLAPVCGPSCPIIAAATLGGLVTLRSGLRRRRSPGGRRTRKFTRISR